MNPDQIAEYARCPECGAPPHPPLSMCRGKQCRHCGEPLDRRGYHLTVEAARPCLAKQYPNDFGSDDA